MAVPLLGSPQLMVWLRFLDPDGFSYATADIKILAGAATNLHDVGLTGPVGALKTYTATGVTRDLSNPGFHGYVWDTNEGGIVTFNCNIWISRQTSDPCDVEVGCGTYGDSGVSDTPNRVTIAQRQKTAQTTTQATGTSYGGSVIIPPNKNQCALDPYIRNYEAAQGIGLYWVEWTALWTPFLQANPSPVLV